MATGASPELALPRLRILAGSGAGGELTVSPEHPVVLGRDPASDLVLEGTNVSRRHACIAWDGVRLTIENLGSTNGIYINGAKVDRSGLELWDVITVGPNALRVVDLPSAKAPAAEAAPTSLNIRLPPADHPRLTAASPLIACLLNIQRLLAKDGDNLVERSLQTLFGLLPVTRLCLFTVTDDGGVTQGYTATRGGGAASHMSHTFARKVLAAGRAILMEDAGGLDQAEWGRTMSEQAVRAILGVPVVVDSRTVAVLLCDNLDLAGVLGEGHVELLESVGHSLGAVFQRERMRALMRGQLRAEREFLAAQKVQAQIFTKRPDDLPGPVRWVVHYRPALELSGDFYDLHHDAQGTTWVIADVSGKGIPAALVVSMLKAFCKVLYPRGLGPLQLLRELNLLFQGELPGHMFLTAIVAQVGPQGLLTWCNVGHPPGMVLAADGAVRSLEASPGMVGNWPDADFTPRLHEGVMQLASRDRVLLVTDGASEAADEDGELLGNDGLRRLLSSQLGQNLPQALAGLVEGLDAYRSGGHQQDDITMVLGEMA